MTGAAIAAILAETHKDVRRKNTEFKEHNTTAIIIHQIHPDTIYMYHHLSRWTDADDVDDQPYQRNAIRTMQH
jgi:hypothetical protein